jgi:hypothetical protein
MPGTISEHWLTHLVIPLAACLISLFTWRVLVNRGWDRVLPVLSLYVIFSSLTSVILLPLSHPQLYPGAFQSAVCRLYAGGYRVTSLMIPLLLAATIVELTQQVSGQNAATRRRYTAAVTGGMVSLGTLCACLIVLQGGVAQGILEMILNWASLVNNLVIIALVLRLLLGKRRRLLAFESSLTLIPIIVGTYYLLDLVFFFLLFHRNSPAEQGMAVRQTLWFAYATAFYWALAREPRIPQGAFLPTER